jgi:hypothetical protein
LLKSLALKFFHAQSIYCIPHVLPLGFAAGTRALRRVHVLLLHTDTYLSYPEDVYSSQALEPRAESLGTMLAHTNQYQYQWATSV